VLDFIGFATAGVRTFNPVAAGSNPAPFTILKSSKPLQSLAETLMDAGFFF